MNRRLNNLMDQIWPQDPLYARKKERKGKSTEIKFGGAKIGPPTQTILIDSETESLKGEDSTTSACNTSTSQIRKQFSQIKRTETKLNNKISNYIRKRGPNNFVKSQFVVTSRQRGVKPSREWSLEVKTDDSKNSKR